MGKEKLSCIYFSLLVSAKLEAFFRDTFNITIWIIINFFSQNMPYIYTP